MPTESTRLTLAATFIETVMLVLPIWLAGVRYFLEEFEEEQDTRDTFVMMVVLTFFSLAAVLVSAGTIITGHGRQLQAIVYGMWLLFFTTGAIAFFLIQKSEESLRAKLALRGASTFAILFLVVSFVLMVFNEI